MRGTKRPFSSLEASPPRASQRSRCAPCNRDFTSQRSLARHRRESDRHRTSLGASLGNHHCWDCAKSFVRAYDRERHSKEQHADGKVSCRDCAKLIRPRAPHKCVNPGMNVPEPIDRDAELAVAYPKNDTEEEESCGQMCFLGFGGHPNQTAQAGHGGSRQTIDNRARNPRARRRIACGICHKYFELRDPAALFSHLNEHFQALQTSPHKCAECEISFSHPSDLERHLRSAARGDCGFSFVHKMPCPGHHPPATHSRTTCRYSCDDDRFNFSYRLSHWEQAQLVGFRKSVEQVVRASQGTRYPSPAATVASCRAHPDDYPRASQQQALYGALSRPGCLTDEGVPGLRRSRSFTEGMYSFGSSPSTSTASARPQGQATTTLKQTEDTWNNVLWWATASGNREIMDAAILEGADVNAEDASGVNAMELAAICGDLRGIELLLREGADPSLKRNACKGLLNLAVDKSDSRILEMLLARGNPPVHLLQRAVMKACNQEDFSCLRVLFAHQGRLTGEQLDKLQRAIVTHATVPAFLRL